MDDDAEGPLTAGREIAGYRIVRAIGAGRSGITYEALNVGTGRRYAIREFFPTGRASRQAGGQVIFATCEADVVAWALDRFECWTNELRQLRHPNIVEIFHYVKENNTCYVIMEYVDGVTFESWLDARAGPPRPAELKPLLEPVLDAVAYLHKMGHIHRDIAAENIMIRPDGRPVLVDFGALKVIGKRTNPLRPLERRKPSYSPPEQLGDDTLDWTADVYALGGVLYRAFARVPPLDADKRMRAVDVTGHDPYVPIARAAKIDLAAEIASAIDRSLAPRSKDRPQSVVELRNALRWGNDEEHSSPKSENRSQSEARAAIAAGIDHPKSFHPETQDNAERTRTEFDRGYAPETVHPPPHRPAVPQAARTAQQKQWRLGYATIATMALVIIAIGTAAVMQKLLHPDRDTNPEQSPTFAICRQAEFESAKRVGTIPAWTDLLRQCVSGPLADEARRELTMRSAAVREAFNDAKRRDTPEAWDKLLRQFPDLDDLDAEQAAFARAKRTGTIEAWEEFVRQFPSGRLTAAEAGQELQKLVLVRREKEAFDLAKATGTIEAWEEFLRQFPSGRLAAEARQEVRKLLALPEKKPTTPSVPLPKHAERTLKPGDIFKECESCPEMVVVPKGQFMMGSADAETGRFVDEGPRHEVKIASPFAVGKVHVTVDQFSAFVGETGYDAGSNCGTLEGGRWAERQGRSWRTPGFSQTGFNPAVCLNWNDTQAYVTWLSRKTGKTYRLLTEAEWEYAARADSTTRYYFGNDARDFCRYGNGADLTAKKSNPNLPALPCDDGYLYTAPVANFRPNAFALYDMLGNAWQWVQDCWNDSYRATPSDGSAAIAGVCGHRILRGGAWTSDARYLRTAYRYSPPADFRLYITSFRVARSLEP